MPEERSSWSKALPMLLPCAPSWTSMVCINEEIRMAGERTDQQCHRKLISAVARHSKSEAASHVAAKLAGVLLRATPGTPQTQVHLIAAKECIGNIQVGWQKIDGAPVIGDASCRREPGQAQATAPAPERMRESVGGEIGRASCRERV